MQQALSRRTFLARTARGVGAGVAMPQILASSVLGREGAAPPSERVRTGHIGVGGMGSHHLRNMVHRPDAEVTAICDVDASRRDRACQVVGKHCAAYADFRELLERKDIDAVIVASPDHWHALHSIHACEAGKDVYCEKPMMKTIREGQAMVRAARRYGRIVQIGTQGRSTVAGRCTSQFVRNGHCGRVHTVRTWHYNNPKRGWEAPREPPRELDWDLWLGPARWVPYHPARCHGSFRWFMDFGGGQIRDRGAHIFTHICWAMNVDDTGPVAVECLKGTRPQGMFDCPNDFEVKYDFNDPDWTLYWRQPGEKYADQRFGMKFFGTRDDLVLMGGDSSSRAVPKALQMRLSPGDMRLYESNDHMGNFLDGVRTRRRTIMDVAIGHRVTSLCILGNLAFRIGRKLNWDPVKQEFVGDEAANRLLHYPYRPPWRLPL